MITDYDMIKETIDTTTNMKVGQLIFSKDSDNCSLIIGTEMFSSQLIIPKSLALDTGLLIRDKHIPLFVYEDSELPEAWKKSYIDGGIEEKDWDRRTEFNPYDRMSEMFCIDSYFLSQIMGDAPVPDWEEGAIKWYRSKMVHSAENE